MDRTSGSFVRAKKRASADIFKDKSRKRLILGQSSNKRIFLVLDRTEAPKAELWAEQNGSNRPWQYTKTVSDTDKYNQRCIAMKDEFINWDEVPDMLSKLIIDFASVLVEICYLIGLFG